MKEQCHKGNTIFNLENKELNTTVVCHSARLNNHCLDVLIFTDKDKSHQFPYQNTHTKLNIDVSMQEEKNSEFLLVDGHLYLCAISVLHNENTEIKVLCFKNIL